MKVKKYTNSAWTDLDKPVKKFGTYTDTATTLPLTIQTSATDAVENYQVYGKTVENLADAIIEHANIGSDGNVMNPGLIDPAGDTFVLYTAPVVSGKTYTITTSTYDSTVVYAFYSTQPTYDVVSYNNARTVLEGTHQATITAPITGWIAFRDYVSAPAGMIVEGSTPAPVYVPPGASGGCGEETENILTLENANIGYRINPNGNLIEDANYTTSDFISTGTATHISCNIEYGTYVPIAEYDVNQTFIKRTTSGYTLELDSNTKYIKKTIANGTNVTLVEGSTAPSSHIPHGYKIPISLTDGTSTSNYDLFIGDNKLYEDEYVDYESGKVYKRTENLFDKDATFDVGYLNAGTGIVNPSNTNYRTTDYIKVTGQNVISLVNPYYSTSTGSLTRIALYDNAKTYISDVVSSGTRPEQYSATFDTGTGEKYIRISIRITDYDIMLVSGSTAPETYIPYLQPTDPPAPFPTISTYIGENNFSVDTTVQPEKVVCEYKGWKQAGSDGEVRYYHNGWVNTPPPAKPSWLADGYEAVLDAKTAPSNYYCDLAYIENNIQMVYRVYVSSDTVCRIEHPDNYISVFQNPYSSSFRGFTTYGVRYNNGTWDVATTASNQDRGQTAYASIASQRAILASTITNLTNASGYTFEDYR